MGFKRVVIGTRDSQKWSVSGGVSGSGGEGVLRKYKSV